MKRKILISSIILVLMFVLSLGVYDVKAENEEIEETNEIVSNSTEAENTSASETVTTLADDDDGSGDTEEDTQSDEDWTDFSNAKFELKKGSFSDAFIEISGVTPKENHSYSLYITSNSNKPDVFDENGLLIAEGRITMIYDKDSKTLKTSSSDEMANYVELNQELYVNICETYQSTDKYKKNVVSYGNKLTRYSEPKYNDAFSATFVSCNMTQIVTTFTHAQSNNRKIQIKVGKITDISILQKIKNENSTGFKELLDYAKSNSGVYDQVLNAEQNDSYAIEYQADKEDNGFINLNGLQDKEYYYLYVKPVDENGKYVSNEAVTLGQALVSNDYWSLHFYGSSDFKWTDWETNPGGGTSSGDDSVVPGTLPKTGYEYVACGGAVIVVAVSGFIAYKKYRKYNF